jgi:hypothetical protein
VNRRLARDSTPIAAQRGDDRSFAGYGFIFGEAGDAGWMAAAHASV